MKYPVSSFCLAVLFFLVFSLPVFAGVTAPNVNYEKIWQNYWAKEASIEPQSTYPFEACFKLAARKYQLPRSLLLAVARGESFFDPKAKSNKNCYGLMQIRWPETAKHLGINKRNDLLNPCTNVLGGAKYLRELIDRYDGNLHLALAAYNYGPSRIPRHAVSTAIPQGANWYSGYIHHHLKSILKDTPPGHGNMKTYIPQKRLSVIKFSQAYRAKGFLNFVHQKAPSLKMDFFRTYMGRFQVVLLYNNSDELLKGRNILKHLGIEVTLTLGLQYLPRCDIIT